jgi:hypothetical protein
VWSKRRFALRLAAMQVVDLAALLAGTRRPRLRSLTGAGLVAYYAAAVTFHVRSDDPWTQTAPAALYGAVAAAVV